MMGRTHATSGAVAFLLLVPPLRWAGLDFEGVGVAVGALAAAGAAMLPDLDHPQATIAQALGPMTGLLARATAWLSGGHRHGTHSVLGVLAATTLSVVMMLIGGVAVGLESAFLAALALAAMQVKFSRVTLVHTALCLAAGVVVTSLSVWQQIPDPVLPLAVGIGGAAHIAGDCLTEEGCPLLWPMPWRVSLLHLKTEGLVERFVVGPLLGLSAAILIWKLSDQSALEPFKDALRRGTDLLRSAL